jgi:hypothetical protein
MSRFGKAEGGGRRSAPRAAVPVVAVFTTVTRSHAATIIDISSTGARLAGTNLPQPGEGFNLKLESVITFATVKWSTNGECGVEFDPPLLEADLQYLRHRSALAHSNKVKPELKAAFDDWTNGLAR